MRTTLPLSVATAVLMALSCSSGGPTVCGEAIPQQTVNVGETSSVETCFEDPGGGTLSYSVSSADAEIVGASIRVGSTVAFRGLSIGQTAVTVTATNEGGMSANVEFQVLVPNRAPTFISSVTEAAVVLDRSIMWNLHEFFEEPDGEAMTFAATSSNASAVGVRVADSVAEVSGLSDGQSQVTLTATDPHDENGTGMISVTVRVPVTLIEDEFDSEASLDDWTWHEDMERSVEDGYLRLRFPTEGSFSWAIQGIDDVSDLFIETTMAPIAGGITGVWWHTGSHGYWFVTGTLIDNRNWILANAADGGSLVILDGGNSNLIEIDEFEDYVVSVTDAHNFVVTVGGDEVINITLDDAVTTMSAVGLTGGNVTSEYDRIKVSGFLSSSDGADVQKIERPIMIRETAPIKQ